MKKNTPPTGLPALLSIAQVADATGFSDKTVRRWIEDGILPANRIGPRCIRIELDNVLALLGCPLPIGARIGGDAA
jgi:excisionase family DNA binding protein